MTQRLPLKRTMKNDTRGSRRDKVRTKIRIKNTVLSSDLGVAPEFHSVGQRHGFGGARKAGRAQNCAR